MVKKIQINDDSIPNFYGYFGEYEVYYFKPENKEEAETILNQLEEKTFLNIDTVDDINIETEYAILSDCGFSTFVSFDEIKHDIADAVDNFNKRVFVEERKNDIK